MNIAIDWSHVGTAVGTLVVSGSVAGIWRYLRTRSSARAHLLAIKAKAKIDAPADMLEAMTAFHKTLIEQNEALTNDLRHELGVQARKLEKAEGRIRVLEAENEACRLETIQIRGELATAVQRANSLEAQLLREGINLTPCELPGSFVVLEDGRATVIKPKE